MRSIESNYKSIAQKRLDLGVYPNLVRAITGREFSRKSIVKAFKKLMPKEEYVRNETKGLVDYLEHCSMGLEEVEIKLK